MLLNLTGLESHWCFFGYKWDATGRFVSLDSFSRNLPSTPNSNLRSKREGSWVYAAVGLMLVQSLPSKDALLWKSGI